MMNSGRHEHSAAGRSEDCATGEPAGFPFWTVGPLSGLFAGLAHVLGCVAAWLRHGSPDFLFRGAEAVLPAALVASLCGGLFGVLYARVVRFGCRSIRRQVRPRLHFLMAGAVSFVVSYAAAEFWMKTHRIGHPLLVIVLTVVAVLVSAFMTSVQHDPTHSDG